MDSKDELKEINIKNHACYYFDDIIIDFDINFDNIYENISDYAVSYKISTGPKPLRIRFNKIVGFIRVRGGEFRLLILFDHGLFDKFCDKIKYLISKISGITDSTNHNFGKIRTDSYHFLPIEKISTFHNVIILVKALVNKNKNEYYYNMFLEKTYFV